MHRKVKDFEEAQRICEPQVEETQRECKQFIEKVLDDMPDKDDPCYCVKYFLFQRYTTEEIEAVNKVMTEMAYATHRMGHDNPLLHLLGNDRFEAIMSVLDHSRMELKRRNDEWNIESFS